MNELTATKDKALSLFAQENFEHAMKVCEFISKSDMVPKNMKGKPADILISMEYGRRLGLGELQAIQNIAVINGKPSLYGDAVLAACQGHPDFQNINEVATKDKDGGVLGFCCTVSRRGYDPVCREFTIKDATQAGLWGKQGPWSQYPARMLQMRARSWALRDAFADALSGVSVREEVEDYAIKDVTPRREKAASLLAGLVPSSKDMIDKNQKTYIAELFEAGKFNDARKNAALLHFKVDNVDLLTFEDADKLIVILEGMV